MVFKKKCSYFLATIKLSFLQIPVAVKTLRDKGGGAPNYARERDTFLTETGNSQCLIERISKYDVNVDMDLNICVISLIGILW